MSWALAMVGFSAAKWLASAAGQAEQYRAEAGYLSEALSRLDKQREDIIKATVAQERAIKEEFHQGVQSFTREMQDSILDNTFKLDINRARTGLEVSSLDFQKEAWLERTQDKFAFGLEKMETSLDKSLANVLQEKEQMLAQIDTQKSQMEFRRDWAKKHSSFWDNLFA